MEPSREDIEHFKGNYGLEEKEARVAYHLRRVRELIRELYLEELPPPEEDPKPGFWTAVDYSVHVSSHISALNGVLRSRVVARDYPEGWGRRPEAVEENPEG